MDAERFEREAAAWSAKADEAAREAERKRANPPIEFIDEKGLMSSNLDAP
jgi:hypothetical protein